MNLYQREAPIFITTPDSQRTPCKILDLLIHWTERDRVYTGAGADLAPGTTVFDIASSNSFLQFTAKAPEKFNDHAVCYQKQLPIGNPIAVHTGLDYTVDQTQVYTVTVNGNPLSYQVTYYTAARVRSVQYSDGSYILLDDTVDTWPAANSQVEPFHIIFDPTSWLVPAVTMVLSDQAAYDRVRADYPELAEAVQQSWSGNGPYYNPPEVIDESTPDADILEKAYNISLVDNKLSLARKTEEKTSKVAIRSINGIFPVNNNINIKVLS